MLDEDFLSFVPAPSQDHSLPSSLDEFNSSSSSLIDTTPLTSTGDNADTTLRVEDTSVPVMNFESDSSNPVPSSSALQINDSSSPTLLEEEKNIPVPPARNSSSTSSSSTRFLQKSISFLLPDDKDDDDNKEEDNDLSHSSNFNLSDSPCDSLDQILSLLSGESEIIYDNLSTFIINLKDMKYKQEKLFSHTFRTLRYTQQSLSTLQLQHASIQDEFHQLQLNYQQLQSSNNINNEKILFYEQKINEMEIFQQNLMNEKKNLVDVLESLNSTVSEEKSKELQLEIIIQQKDQEIFEIKTEKLNLNQQIHENEVALQSMAYTTSTLQQEVQNLQNLFQQKEEENKQLNEVNKELNELLSTTQQQYDERLKETAAEHQQQLTACQQQYDERLRETAAEHQQQLTACQQQYDERLKETVAEHQQQLTACQQQYDERLKETVAEHQQQLTACQQQYDERLRETVAEHQQQLTACHDEIKELQDKYQESEESLKQQLTLLENEKKTLQGEVNTLQEQSRNQQQTITELEGKYQHLLHEKDHEATTTTTSQLQQLQAENTKLKNLISEYQHRMKLGSEELKRMKNENTTLEHLKVENEMKFQQQIKELQNQNHEITELFNQLTLKYNEQMTTQGLMNEQLVNNQRIQQIIETNSSLENELKNLQNEIQRKKQENQEINEIVQQKSQELEDLMNKNQDLRGNIEKLKKEYESITHEENELTKELINTKLGLAVAAGEVDVEHNKVTKLKKVLSTGAVKQGGSQTSSPAKQSPPTTEPEEHSHSLFGSGQIKIDTAAFKKKLVNPAMALNKWKKFSDSGDDSPSGSR